MAKTRGPKACVERAVKNFVDTSARMEKMFQTYDVILSPVMRLPPDPLGDHAPTVEFKTLLPRVLDVVGYTPLHNAVGSTAMSVPLEWTSDGLPIGSQFAAWRGGETTLISPGLRTRGGPSLGGEAPGRLRRVKRPVGTKPIPH